MTATITPMSLRQLLFWYLVRELPEVTCVLCACFLAANDKGGWFWFLILAFFI